MRIVYGVHGFGRGHAMRALAILPELIERHEVLILAGGDAYNALWPDYPVVRIPRLRYYYNRRGKLSNYLNIKHNISTVLDLKLYGSSLDMVCDHMKEFKPDVVLTDSEAFTHRAAARMGIPRITFDHFGLLAYCRLPLSSLDRLIRRGNAFVYKWLFGEPDRAVVTGFFEPPARRSGVTVVGPVIREEVRQVTPKCGDYLLVYLSQGDQEYTQQMEQALMELDLPVRVYGTSRRGLQNNVQYKPLANLPFIEDLAGCRAILATTGNQLCGEVIYFGKPMLGIPLPCLEQRINAQQIERIGIGMQARKKKISASMIRAFLSQEERFAQSARREFRDGKREALDAIERYMQELTKDKQDTTRHTGKV